MKLVDSEKVLDTIEKVAVNKGMTVTDAFKNCGISICKIDDMKHGEYMLKYSDMNRLAEELGVEVEELYRGYKITIDEKKRRLAEELKYRRKYNKNTDETEMIRLLNVAREKVKGSVMWKSTNSYIMLLVEDEEELQELQEVMEEEKTHLKFSCGYDKFNQIRDDVDILYVVREGKDREYIEYTYVKKEQQGII